MSRSGPYPDAAERRTEQLIALATALVHTRPFTEATAASINLSTLITVNGHDQVAALTAELAHHIEQLSAQTLTIRRLDSAHVHGPVYVGLHFVLLSTVCAQHPDLLPIFCRRALCFSIVRAHRPYLRLLQAATWTDLYRYYHGKVPGGFRARHLVHCSCE